MTNFAIGMQTQEKDTLAKWVERRLYRGFYTFSCRDVENDFPSRNESYIPTALTRLVKHNKVISPARGFYVIVPVEHALSRVVPPTFYIDQMMAYLGRGYYVGLLNAAAFYGAAHQRPQTFTVMNNGGSIKDGMRAGVEFRYINREAIDDRFVFKHKTKLGSINVSSPELTAIDLVAHQATVGGLNRVCTVMNELAESLDFSSVDDSFFKIYGVPVYQRLGYILDDIVGETALAHSFFNCMKASNISYRKTVFKTGKQPNGCPVNEKWKIIVNQEIDIDE